MALIKKIEEFNSNTAEKSGNTGKNPLTVEKLRSFEGLADISGSEAEEMIHSIQNLCAIIYDFITQPDISGDNIITNTNHQKSAA